MICCAEWMRGQKEGGKDSDLEQFSVTTGEDSRRVLSRAIAKAMRSGISEAGKDEWFPISVSL